ncbi:MAG: aminopeptidase [Pseudomonadota bacterium]
MDLTTFHRAQRDFAQHVTGISDPCPLPLCDKWPVLPLTQQQEDILVTTLIESGLKAGSVVWLQVGRGGVAIGNRLMDAIVKHDIQLHVQLIDPDFQGWLLTHATEEQAAAYGAAIASKLENVTRRFSLYPMTEQPPAWPIPPEKARAYQSTLKALQQKSMAGDIHSTMTMLPTPETAALDGMSFTDYIDLYINMCDQPWTDISTSHLHLIDVLNKTDDLRITNTDGTDIRMSLTDHDGRPFTFCNSLTKRNVPGSEVFSAPRRDSINGRIVAKGLFMAGHKRLGLIRDLTLDFKDGQIVNFSAAEGEDYFAEFLNRDPSNRYVGELGIGTNPYLKRHVCNGLLVEKIGGSFHLALGDAYTMTDYLGDPVYVDNGNKTATGDHWDITTMLFGKGGVMTADGQDIMRDGIFLAPELDVLNRGWAALPSGRIPDRWKNKEQMFVY